MEALSDLGDQPHVELKECYSVAEALGVASSIQIYYRLTVVTAGEAISGTLLLALLLLYLAGSRRTNHIGIHGQSDMEQGYLVQKWILQKIVATTIYENYIVFSKVAHSMPIARRRRFPIGLNQLELLSRNVESEHLVSELSFSGSPSKHVGCFVS